MNFPSQTAVLAYVFWHWKQPNVDPDEYERLQANFHRALEADPPPAFRRSFSNRLSGAPWAADGGDAYEDWYFVQDFNALAELKKAAIEGSRSAPHDAAATGSLGGSAGVYELRLGRALARPGQATWFSKPPGMRYSDLFASLEATIEQSHGALWMRQLVLGPAREFCLHTLEHAPLPIDGASPLTLPFHPIWPAE